MIEVDHSAEQENANGGNLCRRLAPADGPRHLFARLDHRAIPTRYRSQGGGIRW